MVVICMIGNSCKDIIVYSLSCQRFSFVITPLLTLAPQP